MYLISTKPNVDKIFFKLSKKNQKQMQIIADKIQQIAENPHHFKPLKGDMSGSRRVHFGHFALTYEIDEEKQTVIILDYDHHDNIY